MKMEDFSIIIYGLRKAESHKNKRQKRRNIEEE